MLRPEILSSDYPPEQLSGLLDEIKKIGGAALKVIDKIRQGGRVVIQQPGGGTIELDTRDPDFLKRLRETVTMFGKGVSFQPGAGEPGAGEAIGARVGGFLASPAGAAMALGGAALLFMVLAGRRR